MGKPRHKLDTKTFEQLTYEEQAKSINAEIINLQRAIIHHIQNSKKPSEARNKCLKQINRLMGRLLEKS